MWRLFERPTVGRMRMSSSMSQTAQSWLPLVAICEGILCGHSASGPSGRGAEPSAASRRFCKQMSSPLPEEAAPSVPMRTSTPASLKAGSERVPPQASFMLRRRTVNCRCFVPCQAFGFRFSSPTRRAHRWSPAWKKSMLSKVLDRVEPRFVVAISDLFSEFH